MRPKPICHPQKSLCIQCVLLGPAVVTVFSGAISTRCKRCSSSPLCSALVDPEPVNHPPPIWQGRQLGEGWSCTGRVQAWWQRGQPNPNPLPGLDLVACIIMDLCQLFSQHISKIFFCHRGVQHCFLIKRRLLQLPPQWSISTHFVATVSEGGGS